MRGLIWTVIVLTVIIGGATVADGLARSIAQDQVAAEIDQALPGIQGSPEVTIGGFPFLTQVAAGRLTTVEITADQATVEGLRLEDVVVVLDGVTTRQPFVAERGTMTALVRAEEIGRTMSLDLSMRDGELVASMSVLGLPLDVRFEARPAGRDVEVDVTGFVLAGASVDAEGLPAALTAQLQGLAFPVPGLPQGMALTAVTATAEGLVLTAQGSDLPLRQT
jgi:hypothetical protein